RFQNFLRQAQLLPLHNTQREQALVRARMNGLAADMLATGSVALGPGHYALGQGYLALGEEQQARHQLEVAWGEGYRSPEVAFALGRVLSQLYRQALDEARANANKELRQARSH